MYEPFSLVPPEKVFASGSHPGTRNRMDESGTSDASRFPRYSEVSCTGPDTRSGPAVSSHSGYASSTTMTAAAVPKTRAAAFHRPRVVSASGRCRDA